MSAQITHLPANTTQEELLALIGMEEDELIAAWIDAVNAGDV